ncbi:hypothetical protein [Flavobacterium succinicans]|uniref:Uncharacterized protein n=1 Tax=Flavobacterium succinicans TaxID=29536 RepID=A0A199XUP1_9FLAO|nr:hypothetical protein [Flavobacterium succinicans]OAZ04956.1 hypothetical protein FLB_08040 [Flavobacterium succinicans]
MSKPTILFLSFALFFCFQLSNAQAYKFQTSGYSVLEKNEKGKWGEWSELDLINISITLDITKHRIVVYTPLLQMYSILSYGKIDENKTDIIYSFECKDENGDACTLMIITRKQQGNRKQLYINYENRIYLYNL